MLKDHHSNYTISNSHLPKQIMEDCCLPGDGDGVGAGDGGGVGVGDGSEYDIDPEEAIVSEI